MSLFIVGLIALLPENMPFIITSMKYFETSYGAQYLVGFVDIPCVLEKNMKSELLVSVLHSVLGQDCSTCS